jgi:hypothetical protein
MEAAGCAPAAPSNARAEPDVTKRTRSTATITTFLMVAISSGRFTVYMYVRVLISRARSLLGSYRDGSVINL